MTKIFCTYRNWKSFYIKTDLILYNMKENSIYLYITFLEHVDLTISQIELRMIILWDILHGVYFVYIKLRLCQIILTWLLKSSFFIFLILCIRHKNSGMPKWITSWNQGPNQKSFCSSIILVLKDSLSRPILNIQDIDVVIKIRIQTLYDLWL